MSNHLESAEQPRRPSLARRVVGRLALGAYNTLFPKEVGGYNHQAGAPTRMQQRLGELAGIDLR